MVFAYVKKMQTPGILITHFEKVILWASEASQPKTAQAAEEASKFIAMIIHDEVSDADASQGVVSRTVSALQEIIREGRSEDEITFP